MKLTAREYAFVFIMCYFAGFVATALSTIAERILN